MPAPVLSFTSSSPAVRFKAGISTIENPRISYPPDSCCVVFSTLSRWNDAIMAKTMTVNIISANMKMVRAVRNFLFIG